MSERDESGLDGLERKLDQAFATTRPRRGFEDELWARLQARRPWWRRLGGVTVSWAGAGSAAGLLLVVGLIALVVLRSGGGAGGAVSTSSSSAGLDRPQAPAMRAPSASSQGSGLPGAAAGQYALPFGPLPSPAAAGAPQVIRAGVPSPLPFGERLVSSAFPPVPGPSLAVYRYDPASGPPAGSVLEVGALPAGLATGIYPSRQAPDAFSAAAIRESSGLAADRAEVDLTQARLVYVAVVSGGEGYLEPAYLFTGTWRSATGTTAPAQLLVPALAASALR